jgi:hypothetical protein
MDSKFYTIIYLGPYHFLKNHLDNDSLPPLSLTELGFTMLAAYVS